MMPKMQNRHHQIPIDSMIGDGIGEIRVSDLLQFSTCESLCGVRNAIRDLTGLKGIDFYVYLTGIDMIFENIQPYILMDN